MSVEANKETVQKWIAAANRQDEATILSLLAPDFQFQGMGRSPEWVKYSWGRDAFAGAPKSMSQLMKSPIQLELVGMIGEGEQLAVEAKTDCDMLNGKKYDNAYHFVISFRDGLITGVKEYCCTHLVDTVFGEYNR